MTKLKIILEYKLDETNGRSEMSYSGECSPMEFDRSLLSMIKSLMDAREDEYKKRGLSKTLLRSSGKGNKDNEFEEP